VLACLDVARTNKAIGSVYKEILEVVRSGRSANSIAREYEIARLTITNWLKQDDLDDWPAFRRFDNCRKR
jgi:hypothetical protein